MKKHDTLRIALGEYGIKEIVGRKDNPEVLKYFKALGFGNLKDETAWCSAFANWVALKARVNYSGKLTARSWLKVGKPVDYNPEPGDIVVLWRERRDSWKGHVGFFVRQTERYVYVLGGNQSNKVCIRAYRKNRLLGYRDIT